MAIFEVMKKVHIGRLIRSKFEASGMTKKAFADKIGLSVRHLYTLFEKDSVDTGLLQKISDVLNYNFFQAFSNYKEPVQSDEAEEPGLNKSIVQLKLEINLKGRLNKRDILNSVREELDQLL